MTLIHLARHSAWYRRSSVLLLMISIAAACFLFLAVDTIRNSMKSGFEESVSGTDLIVAARNHPLSVVLYSVFRVGSPTNQLPYAVGDAIIKMPEVAWVVPIALGDSYREYSVVGTTPAYFEHFRYGQGQYLQFAEGQAFAQWHEGKSASLVYQAVIGAEVARSQQLKIGSPMVLTHGRGLASATKSKGSSSDADHADKPFVVSGILQPTGTPVDRSVHISVEGLEAIHLNWQGGVAMKGAEIPADLVTRFDLKPKEVTSFLVGLKSRARVFQVRRELESSDVYPLTAVMPGLALADLWKMVGQVERVLMAVSALVGVVSMLGLLSFTLAVLGQRKRELLLLRVMGISRVQLLGMVMLEGALVMLAGAFCGVALLLLVHQFAAPLLMAQLSVPLLGLDWTGQGMMWVVAYVLAGLLMVLVPACMVYRHNALDELQA